MIGPKKLSVIRKELHDALTATGDDPILWLEERMSVPCSQIASDSGANEVLASLRCFLEATKTKNRRTKRSGAKKESRNR